MTAMMLPSGAEHSRASRTRLTASRAPLHDECTRCAILRTFVRMAANLAGPEGVPSRYQGLLAREPMLGGHRREFGPEPAS